MNETLKTIEHELASAKSPVVLSSFGKDSLLLLWLVRQIKPDVPVIWFHDGRDPFAESVIMDWDLTVLSYRPADRYLVPNGEGLMLVDEYAVGSSRLPTLRDVVVGERCELEALSSTRTPTFNYPFDITFFGFKSVDAADHAVTNHTVLPQRFALGHTAMIAPLYNWSDSEVLDAIDSHGIPYESRNDSVSMCQQCADSLNGWDGSVALLTFQQRFGFVH